MSSISHAESSTTGTTETLHWPTNMVKGTVKDSLFGVSRLAWKEFRGAFCHLLAGEERDNTETRVSPLSLGDTALCLLGADGQFLCIEHERGVANVC